MCNYHISDSFYNSGKAHYISGKSYNFFALAIKAIKDELPQEPKAFHHLHELYFFCIFHTFKNCSEEKKKKNKEKMSPTEFSVVLDLFCWKTYNNPNSFFKDSYRAWQTDSVYRKIMHLLLCM